MTIEKITFCIGYVGMTLQYHTIEIVENNTCILQKSIVKEKFKRQEKKNIMLSPRRKFFSIHKPKKKKREKVEVNSESNENSSI